MSKQTKTTLADPARIVIEAGLLSEIGKLIRDVGGSRLASSIILVTDDKVGPIYADAVAQSFHSAGLKLRTVTIPHGEASKSLHQVGRLYECLAANNADRDAILIALGGGVVSDLTGFVAATWMRGVRFAICPTTMEADVDACLGGKTAVNLSTGKNLVGVFHNPFLIAIDPRCLVSLEPRDVRAGLAESLKHALLDSESMFAWHEVNAEAILRLDETIVRALIERNLAIKSAIVGEDMHERSGVRVQLNLGHTIGHAIESGSEYALRHGECVGLGLLTACRLSQAFVALDGSVVSRLDSMLRRLGLLTHLEARIPWERIGRAMRADKKVVAGKVHFVLLKAIGEPVVCDDVPERLVRDAYESILKS